MTIIPNHCALCNKAITQLHLEIPIWRQLIEHNNARPSQGDLTFATNAMIQNRNGKKKNTRNTTA